MPENILPSSPATLTRRQIITKNQSIRDFKNLYSQWDKCHKTGLEIIINDLRSKILDFGGAGDADRKKIRFAQIHNSVEELKTVYSDLKKILENMESINKSLNCSDSKYICDSLTDELGNKLLVCNGIFDFGKQENEENLNFYASCWKHQPSINIAQLKLSLKALEEKIVPT